MLKNKNKIWILIVLFVIGYLSIYGITAAASLKYAFPCPNLPGIPCPDATNQASQSPAAYIARFYQFALGIAGLLAFVMIVWGAIQYIVSAGNATQQSDARDRIWQALWGVALLLGAYLILYTIDPNLVNLTDPSIKNIAVPINSTKTTGSGYNKYEWTQAIRQDEGCDGCYSYKCPTGTVRVDESRCGDSAPGAYYFCCATQ